MVAESSPKLVSQDKQNEETIKIQEETKSETTHPSTEQSQERGQRDSEDLRNEENVIKCVDSSSVEPGDGDSSETKNVIVDRTGENEESGDDMEKWMNEHKETVPEISERDESVQFKEADETEEKFQDDAESLEDSAQHKDAIPSSTESVQDGAPTRTAENVAPTELDVQNSVVNDDDHLQIATIKEETKQEQDENKLEDTEVTVEEGIKEGNKSVSESDANKEIPSIQEGESTEEFEILSPLSRETSVEESSLSLVAKGM